MHTLVFLNINSQYLDESWNNNSIDWSFKGDLKNNIRLSNQIKTVWFVYIDMCKVLIITSYIDDIFNILKKLLSV